jgi:hypothetical protein
MNPFQKNIEKNLVELNFLSTTVLKEFSGITIKKIEKR